MQIPGTLNSLEITPELSMVSHASSPSRLEAEQEDSKFKVSLDHIEALSQKENKQDKGLRN